MEDDAEETAARQQSLIAYRRKDGVWMEYVAGSLLAGTARYAEAPAGIARMYEQKWQKAQARKGKKQQ